mmetsp:Transcript_64786/g.94888  ORF Transcript_64786/g.94888 Transcript_64786/m.94888 type:complete len:226 (+) Transcript_64786:3-680(+)
MSEKFVVGVGKEMSEEEKKLLETGHSFMEIDTRYSSFKTVRKDEELKDGNFPVDMAAAMQLFIAAGMRDNASTCKRCMDAQIKILEKGPDGKTQHRLGSGAVCWGCGYVGLPSNNHAFESGKPIRKGTIAVCGGCASDEQTNLVNGLNEDAKTRLPWIEVHSENSEEQQQAAKKAEEAENEAIGRGNGGGVDTEIAEGDRTKGATVGRNDPCSCGSGKKSKKCCN